MRPPNELTYVVAIPDAINQSLNSVMSNNNLNHTILLLHLFHSNPEEGNNITVNASFQKKQI